MITWEVQVPSENGEYMMLLILSQSVLAHLQVLLQRLRGVESADEMATRHILSTHSHALQIAKRCVSR